MQSRQEEEKAGGGKAVARSNSGMKLPTRFIQRTAKDKEDTAKTLYQAGSCTNQNMKPLGHSGMNISASNEHSDQTNSESYINQLDGSFPTIQNLSSLPHRPKCQLQDAHSAQQIKDDEDNLLAAPTQSEKAAIVESNFMSNNQVNLPQGMTKSITSAPVNSQMLQTPVKSLATDKLMGSLSPRLAPQSMLSPNQKSSRKTKGVKDIRASIASIAGVSQSNDKDTVKVVIRIRPINDRERQGGPKDKVKLCLQVEGNQKIILDRGQEQKTFNFDYVALQESEQSELFDKIAKPIADSCLLGYNGTIFAYGQTGSGKTFTIQGPTMQINGEETLIGASNTGSQNHDKRGIMQRSFEYMFDCMEQQKVEAKKQGIEMQFLVKSSYLEIYNEQVMDLLDPSSFNLHVREDIKKGVYVESLLEETVTSVKDMMNLTTRGARNRHVGSTMMNKESSRSHSVLTTTIESKTMNEEGVWQMKSSRFHIIDLAGSERSKATQAQGERLKEAGMINKSLTALGIVINSLVEISEGKNRHVHYRDSKLTFLLRDSLGGNSKTVIIANVTAAAISMGETLSTLNFAQRAKLIKNKAVVNEESSSTIAHLKQELRRVKKDLAEQTNLLKIAHEQLSMQPLPEEQQSNICSICKKEMAGQQQLLQNSNQNQNAAGVKPDQLDESLILQEANFGSNTSINLNNFASNGQIWVDESSLMLDLGTPKNDTPGGQSSTPGQGQQPNNNAAVINPKLLRQYKQRGLEHQAMKERVSKVEKLLSENLENMDFQQKQYEQQINTLVKSNKDRQTALEASEKNIQRDRMIIRFREERIKELESRLGISTNEESSGISGSTNDCEKCIMFTKQLTDAKKEISQWLEVADKNPQVAKLQAECSELLAAKISLQNEIKSTPESLTARIRGLNDLTNNLNSYLKEYCMGEGLDTLVAKLETSNQEMSTKVETLESEIREKDTDYAEKLRSLALDYESKTAQLNDKLESLKASHEAEKQKIEQEARDQMTRLKADLDASQAEKGALQKDIFDKVEAQMKQQEFQRNIDQLNQTVSELNAEKESLNGLIRSEKQEKDRMADLQRQTEASKTESLAQLQERMDTEMASLNTVLKDAAQKANQEIQDLEKEVAAIKEENRMLEESSADLDRKLRMIKLENDSLQKQVLETNEEMEEKRRHVREVESKLNYTIKDLASKTEQLESFEQSQRESIGQMRSQDEGKSKQLGELNAQIALLQAESSTKIKGLESNISQLNQTIQDQAAQIAEQTMKMTQMEQTEKSLKGIVSITDSKVEECARFEVDRQIMQKKIEVLTQEVNQMTDQMGLASREQRAQKEIAKAQAAAQEELILRMTSQLQDRDNEIAQFRSNLTEKDLEIAKTLRELDENKTALRRSQSADQEANDGLKAECASLKQTLEETKAQNVAQVAELDDKIGQLQAELRTERSKSEQESKKAEQAKTVQLNMTQAMARIKEEFKQEFQKETQKNKFALELEYQTKLQNRENELRQQFNSNNAAQQQNVDQEQAQGVIQQELNNSKMDVQKQRQARQLALMTLQGQVKLLKQQHQELVGCVQRELTWKRVGPKIDVIRNIVEQVKVVSKDLTQMRQYQQDCHELKEQLAEYKGLTQQLQEEKLSINTRLQENLAYVETAKAQNAQIIKSLQDQLQASQSALLDTQKALRAYHRNNLPGAEGPAATSTLLVERLQNENKSQQEMLLKREAEIKNLVLTLKAYSDEKTRVESQLEAANSKLLEAGSPTTPSSQETQIKRLKTENSTLLEQVKSLTAKATQQANNTTNTNATFGNLAVASSTSVAKTEQASPAGSGSSTSSNNSTEAAAEKARKELTGIIESIARLAENILKLPGIAQFVGSNAQLKSLFTKHATMPQNNSTSSATYYAMQKIKGIATVINHIFTQLQSRAQECNQMTVEFKRMEAEIQRLQLAQSSSTANQ